MTQRKWGLEHTAAGQEPGNVRGCIDRTEGDTALAALGASGRGAGFAGMPYHGVSGKTGMQNAIGRAPALGIGFLSER